MLYTIIATRHRGFSQRVEERSSATLEISSGAALIEVMHGEYKFAQGGKAGRAAGEEGKLRGDPFHPLKSTGQTCEKQAALKKGIWW